jgi:hypothetical protein
MNKSWLGVQERKQRNMVFDRKDADEMTEDEARRVLLLANRNHPDRTWEIAKVTDGRNLFVVEGTPKK